MRGLPSFYNIKRDMALAYGPAAEEMLTLMMDPAYPVLPTLHTVRIFHQSFLIYFSNCTPFRTCTVSGTRESRIRLLNIVVA
jgi:hypothetical protein